MTQPKHQPPQPKACIAAVTVPLPQGFDWQPLGYFHSKRQARAAVEAHMAAQNGATAFVILRQRARGEMPLYDLLAKRLSENQIKAEGAEP